ncbi:SCO2523 family variant P-loop protein [Phytomonospora sp. NPDC050363]|uniref:SCO2523 family variant P-loop protein n=1 Tax=Phytomonospora sp. NPDC050363 TaxID=3155642 RepID=UPI0033EC7C79
MLVFATSDKGGTGRSLTSCNIAYRSALEGANVAYLDLDLGRPTSGAIFSIDDASRGTVLGGLHRYLLGEIPEPVRLEVWNQSDRDGLRGRPDGAGRLTLLPGDEGGAEFACDAEVLRRCATLFARLEEEYDVILIDLSAGRSHAVDIALRATADPALANVVSRWLVFHRWTRQHIYAAAGLAHGTRGIIETGVLRGHERAGLRAALRFVRTAVADPQSKELSGLSATQTAWLETTDDELRKLAGRLWMGRSMVLGSVPLEPVLMWREQIILDTDVITRQIANAATVDAFVMLAHRLIGDWPEL